MKYEGPSMLSRVVGAFRELFVWRDLQEQVETLEADNKRLKAEVQSIDAELKKTLERDSAIDGFYTRQIDNLLDELATVKSDCDNAIGRNQKYFDDLHQAIADKREMQKAIDEKTGVIEVLSRSMTELEQERNEAYGRNHKYMDDLRQAMVDKRAMQAELDKKDFQIQCLDKNLAGLQSDHDRLLNVCETLKSQSLLALVERMNAWHTRNFPNEFGPGIVRKLHEEVGELMVECIYQDIDEESQYATKELQEASDVILCAIALMLRRVPDSASEGIEPQDVTDSIFEKMAELESRTYSN